MKDNPVGKYNDFSHINNITDMDENDRSPRHPRLKRYGTTRHDDYNQEWRPGSCIHRSTYWQQPWSSTYDSYGWQQLNTGMPPFMASMVGVPCIPAVPIRNNYPPFCERGWYGNNWNTGYSSLMFQTGPEYNGNRFEEYENGPRLWAPCQRLGARY